MEKEGETLVTVIQYSRCNELLYFVGIKECKVVMTKEKRSVKEVTTVNMQPANNFNIAA
jgi:hypothetical protein